MAIKSGGIRRDNRERCICYFFFYCSSSLVLSLASHGCMRVCVFFLLLSVCHVCVHSRAMRVCSLRLSRCFLFPDWDGRVIGPGRVRVFLFAETATKGDAVAHHNTTELVGYRWCAYFFVIFVWSGPSLFSISVTVRHTQTRYGGNFLYFRSIRSGHRVDFFLFSLSRCRFAGDRSGRPVFIYFMFALGRRWAQLCVLGPSRVDSYVYLRMVECTLNHIYHVINSFFFWWCWRSGYCVLMHTVRGTREVLIYYLLIDRTAEVRFILIPMHTAHHRWTECI